MKPHVNVGAIGHVDHGKSILVAAMIHTHLREVTLMALDDIDSLSRPPQSIEMVIKPEPGSIHNPVEGFNKGLMMHKDTYSRYHKYLSWIHSWPPPRSRKK